MNTIGERSRLLHLLRQRERDYFLKLAKFNSLAKPGKEQQNKIISSQHEWQEALEDYNQFFLENCPSELVL